MPADLESKLLQLHLPEALRPRVTHGVPESSSVS
jgi:hypothetical protein